MEYLCNFNHSAILKAIAEVDPSLIYFLCSRGDPVKFPLVANLLDVEKDCSCSILKTYNLVSYAPPSQRQTHQPKCELTRSGKKVFDELLSTSIADKLKTIARRQGITKELFRQQFNQEFSFDINPLDIIGNKVKEFELQNQINLPRNNYCSPIKMGCNHEIEYTITDDHLTLHLLLHCSCKQTTNIVLSKEEIIKHIENIDPIMDIRCERCKKMYFLSSDFFYLRVL